MSYLVLSGVTWACTGTFKVLGLSIQLASFPEVVKPALGAVHACHAEVRHEEFDPARRPEAERRARDLGWALEECRIGRGCRRLDERTSVLSFKP